MKKEITNAVQNLLDQMTDDTTCFAVISAPADTDSDESITVVHGKDEDIISSLGATILSSIYSDDPQQQQHSRLLLDLLEEALISIVSYDENIYRHFASRLMSVMNSVKEADAPKVKRNIPEA